MRGPGTNCRPTDQVSLVRVVAGRYTGDHGDYSWPGRGVRTPVTGTSAVSRARTSPMVIITGNYSQGDNHHNPGTGKLDLRQLAFPSFLVF